MVNDPISAILIDTDLHTPNLSTDTTLADIPEAAILKEAILTGRVLSGAEFQADPTTFPSVALTDGAKADAVIIFYAADTEEESILCFMIDDAAEFPVTPDGSDIVVTWGEGSAVIHEFSS